jgi:hypothetical protein
MSRATTAREALVVEAVADMSALVDRLETLTALLDTQRRAMAKAAQDLFRTEVGPSPQRVMAPLLRLEDLARRGAQPWAHWLTHLATAATASAVACTLTAGLWCGPG